MIGVGLGFLMTSPTVQQSVLAPDRLSLEAVTAVMAVAAGALAAAATALRLCAGEGPATPGPGGGDGEPLPTRGTGGAAG